MEKLFKLKENKTTVRTEIVAGLTTFMTMAYIIALNPNLLTGFAVGTPLWNAVFVATCLASFIGTACLAFTANKPFAMAPGMGLNSFFASVVASMAGIAGVTYLEGFQAALVIILVEGIIFLLLSVLNVREKIGHAIPLGIRIGVAPAIGLMLMNIGLGSNAGVGVDIIENGNYVRTDMYYVMRDFFGALTAGSIKETLGDSWGVMVLTVITMFVGLFAIIALAHKKVKGSVLIGMLIASVINWAGQAIFLKTNPFANLKGASWLPPVGDMIQNTFFKFNFSVLTDIGWVTIITIIITFCIIDMFDTIGTLIGTATRAGMVNDKGDMPQMKQALISDAIGTVVGSATGTSTVTTFIESASGVEEGGRTGLTALTTAVLFLLAMFLSPIAAIIPPAATSAALIYVGILMLAGLGKIDFSDMTQTVPVALMLLTMPVSGSIGHGIGLGLIAYTVIMVFTGKAKKVPVLTYILSVIFLVKFFLAVKI